MFQDASSTPHANAQRKQPTQEFMYDNNYQRTLKHESDSDEEQKQS